MADTSDKNEKIKKSKEQILLERIELEKEASRLIGCPIRFGMSRSPIKSVKNALQKG